MAKLVDIQGRFPCEPDNKKPTLIKKWEYSTALYPPNNAFTSDNTFTLVTTDTFMLGIYELGPGGVFAPLDIHPGDESYYILNGPVVQRCSRLPSMSEAVASEQTARGKLPSSTEASRLTIPSF